MFVIERRTERPEFHPSRSRPSCGSTDACILMSVYQVSGWPKAHTVLVVEDDPALRRSYRTALTLEGFAVVTAEDGFDALRRVEVTPPDAIVLDLGLPRLDGRDVARELTSNASTQHIPIVVVTGESTELNEADFDCVLRKPVSPEMLITAVQNCLRKRKR
jgi:DNA-binding response OmpR family regulator